MERIHVSTRCKRIFNLLTILLIVASMTLWGTASLAEKTTTVNVKTVMSGPQPTMLPAGDDENHMVGLGQRTGEAVFSDGRKAKYSNVFVVDYYRGKSATMWGYTKMVFEDGSWLFFKWDSAVNGSDENGPTSKGTGTILKGAGQYEGIKGKAEFTNRRLPNPPGTTEANAVFTYSLP